MNNENLTKGLFKGCYVDIYLKGKKGNFLSGSGYIEKITNISITLKHIGIGEDTLFKLSYSEIELEKIALIKPTMPPICK